MSIRKLLAGNLRHDLDGIARGDIAAYTEIVGSAVAIICNDNDRSRLAVMIRIWATPADKHCWPILSAGMIPTF
jgi:hypothetical protein